MVFSKWAGSAFLTLLSVSSTGVLAVPAQYKPDPDQIKERQVLTIATGLLTLATRTSSSTTRAATTISSIVAVYGQCGGTGYTGPTQCVSGATCVYNNQFYSQCLPSTSSRTTTRSTTPVYTPPSTTPVYTTPAYTTPGYGYTTPLTSSTISTRTSSTSSTKTSATPSYTPVVGANNTCYNRLKIETLQKSDPDQFNMLLLAWAKVQSDPDSNPFGHYQLAGIHGAPYVPWQWSGTAPEGFYMGGRGYCTHGSALFTSWHRPYLLALEQALFHAAMGIAATFDITSGARAQYLAAAGRLRLPYWDWSDPVTKSNLPAITMQTTVTVIRPGTGGVPTSASITNPLFAYRFLSSSSISTFGSPYNTFMTTSRSASANSAMIGGFSGRVTQTYNAFMSTPYNTFSNRVEGIHDAVHGAIGGHMGTIAYSAFDPIFWLHHCNVDRLMAMYQATQPTYWITPAPAVGTYARPAPPNTVDNTNSPLYPFLRADGSWWRSSHTNPVSTIWGMKYGYPEVPCSYQTRTPAELDTFTTKQINTLYAPRRSTPGIVRDWQVRLLIDQSEIPGGYDVYVYGSYNGRPSDPYADPYRTGYIGSLSSMSLGAPDLYKPSRIRYVDVSLNSYLQDTSYYDSDPYKITSYIQQDLYYTIIANGKPCPFTDLYTAKIAVYSREYYDSGKEDVLPYYTSEPYYHVNATERIPGGIKSVDDILYPIRVDGTREQPWSDISSNKTAEV